VLLKIVYDMGLMKFMDCFSSITHARLKDSFIDDTDMLYFIVEENDIGKAIGKNGYKAKMLEKVLNRKIKIVEFNPDVLQFIKNVIFPLRIKEIALVDGYVEIEVYDSKTRGLLIGRSAKNLHSLELIVKRYFKFNEIRVL
jgi:transcription termination/antitermination protein NusA